MTNIEQRARELSGAAENEPDEMSPDFTDTARAAIAWVLYHHQGGSSPIGQPLRFALGMGDNEPLPDWQIAEARRYAVWAGATSEQFHNGLSVALREAEELRGKLRGLAGKWRETGDGYKPSGTWNGDDMCDRYHWCADELLAQIGEEG